MPVCNFLDHATVHGQVEDGFGGKRILVIGDVMLDRHIWGSVHRISPEAPVPVVRQQRQALVAGGAGNVAMNLAGLGVSAHLFGVVGADESAALLRGELARGGVDASCVQTDPVRPTTTKTRVIGGHQQILRLDNESTEPLSDTSEAALLTCIVQSLPGASAVILSDYAKGVLTPRLCQATIYKAKTHGVPVLVDPKGIDWDKYRGATLITPNRSELSIAMGCNLPDHEAIMDAARDLCKRLDLEGLIVTLSEEGMLHVGLREETWMPAMAQEVFDVSGAGDTAIATLTAAVSSGINTRDSLLLANLAAGVVVGKVGTVPLGRGDLLDALDASRSSPTGAKIHTLSSAKSIVRTWKGNGKKLVFTNGCFDILHAGHVSYLAKARRFGDRLILGLNSDESVRRLKGDSRPINKQESRAFVLAGLECVDMVILFDEDTPLGLIEALKPDVLVKGADYREENVVGAKEVRSRGGEVRLVELVEGVSSTIIANKLTQ